MRNRLVKAMCRVPMNLQLFAEGDGAGTGDGNGGGAGGGNGSGEGNGGEIPPSFDEFLGTGGNQAEFDRRVQKAVNTAVANAQKKREKELSDREAAVTRSELMAEAKNTLSDDGLPVELAEVLNYTDADSCKKSMETVKKAFQTAVEKAVDEKLKGGKPPKKAPETNTQEALEKQVYNAMMGIY